MRKRIVKQVVDITGKILVLINESTTLSSKFTLIYSNSILKCVVCKEDPLQYLFVDLLEINDQTSKTVTTNLLDCRKIV